MGETVQPITDDALAEIEAGLKGVTPGPWDVLSTLTVRAIDGDIAIPIFEAITPWKKHRRTATALKQEWHNAHHVGRMEPAKVRAMIARIRAAEAELKREREALSEIGLIAYLDGADQAKTKLRAAEAERDAALVAASALRNEAASYVEAVKDDRPNFSTQLTPAVDLIRCMDTREIIGARIYIAARAALEESNG